MTAPQTTGSDEEFTELVDADFPRVDLVGKAANGTRFLIAKSAADGHLTQPLVPADRVRELIAKADAQEGTVTDPAAAAVEKAELDVTDAPAADDLIPEPPGGTTAATVPGSPDWEQLDGDTAMNAVAVLGRLKGVLGWLSDREAQEAVTGGDYDADSNSWDLDSMACTLDAMIGALAGFAVGEHMEAEEVAKASQTLAAVTAPLAVVESLAPIAKAGRVLSSANEAAIRGAVDSLTGVLNSLPQAPAADDVTKETAVPTVPKSITVDVVPQFVTADGEPIAKGTDLAAAMLAGAPALAAADVLGVLVNGGRTVDVAKAAGDPQLAVFDADGKLIGTIDPAKLSPIATSPAAAEKTDEPAADDAGTEGDVAPADPAAAPADPAATPDAPDAPATEATIPGTATIQSPPEHDQTVTKAVAAALAEALAPFAEQLGQSVELAKAYGDLKERVEKMGQQPDNRRSPVLNGATGIAGAVTRDSEQGDEKFAELRKAVDEAQTEGQRATASAALAYAKVAARFQR